MSLPRDLTRRQQKLRAVVIGGGFAGLGAARTLLQQSEPGDWEVVVLEAGERVGGRAWSSNVGGDRAVEWGATWIHGIGGGNPIYAHALQLGLLQQRLGGGVGSINVNNDYEQPLWVRPGQEQPLAGPQLDAALASTQAFGRGAERAAELLEGSASDVLRDSWEQLVQEHGAGWSQAQAETAAAAWHWRELLQRAIDGAPSMAELGCRSLYEYNDFPGAHLTIRHGFQAVAEGLAQGLDVRLGHRVQRVSYGPSGCSVLCDGGLQLDAEAVFVSVSVGVLKAQHAALFEPPLPALKAQAIASIGFGVVDKVVVEFEPQDAMPAAAAAAVAAAAGESPPPPAAGLPAGLNGGAPGPTPSGFALLQSSGDVAAGPPFDPLPDDDWTEGLYALHFGNHAFLQHKPAPGQPVGAAVRAVADGPKAVLWITGAHALAMERASDAEVAAGIERRLCGFPGVRPPGWGSGSPLRVRRVWRSNWGADPLFLGSYSYISSAPGAGPDDIAALAEPLEVGGRPAVLFCGEATHAEYFGTTHGALISGEREAARLLAAYAPRLPASQPIVAAAS